MSQIKKEIGFVSAFLKSATSTIINILLNIVVSKIIALHFGPGGVGVFGILKQSIAALSSFGSAGQTSVIHGMSERTDKQQYFNNALAVYLCATFTLLVILGGVYFGCAPFRAWMTQKISLESAALTILAALVGNLLFLFKSALNGQRMIGRLAITDVAGALTLTVAIILSISLTEFGSAMAIAAAFFLANSVMTLLAMVFLGQGRLKIIQSPRSLITSIDSICLRHFFKFAIFNFATILISTGAILSLRAYVSNRYDMTHAGFFELAWALSGGYVVVLLGSFITFYLPALSAEPDLEKRGQLIKQVVRASILLSTPLIVVLIAAKQNLVALLYSDQFYPALDLVKWMLIGDYLKVTTWVFTIPLIARGKMQLFFITESVWWLSFLAASVVSTYVFEDFFLIGVSYLMGYTAILLYYFLFTLKDYNIKFHYKDFLLWSTGLINVVLCSAVFWSGRGGGGDVSGLVIFGVASLACCVSKNEIQAVKKLIRK